MFFIVDLIVTHPSSDRSGDWTIKCNYDDGDDDGAINDTKRSQ